MSNLIIPRPPARYHQGLVALYHADRGKYDASLYGNDLLEENAAISYRITSHGRAFDFNDGAGSTPDYLYAPDHSSLDITGPLTVAVLAVKDAASGGNAGIAAKYAGGGSWTNQRSFGLFTNEQGGNAKQVQFNVSSDGTFANTVSVSSAASALTYGEPFAAVSTYVPGQKLRLNVDGAVTENTTSIPSSLYSGTAPLMIGQQFNDTQEILTWDGGIMLVAVFNRAWTPEEEHAFIVDPLSLVQQRSPNEATILAEAAAGGGGGLTITMSQGLLNIIGQKPEVLLARDVSMQQGVVHTTGQNADVVTGRGVTMTQGVTHVTGQNPEVLLERELNLTQGLTHVTAQNMSITFGRTVTMGQGLVHVTGQDMYIQKGNFSPSWTRLSNNIIYIGSRGTKS